MSRAGDWLYLLGRTRHLPAWVSRELTALHEAAARLPALEAQVAGVTARLAEIDVRVGALAAAVDAIHARQTPEQTARIEQQLAAVMQSLEGLMRSDALAPIAAAITALHDETREHAVVLDAGIRAPARAAAEAALRATLPMPGPRSAGVSVLIPCWHHAGLVEAAVASAQRSLDALPVPGEIVVTDDASRDAGRAQVLRLAAADPRIRVLASAANLGLARARNVQLAQARFRHALLLDADNTLAPAGVAVLHASAVATGATMAYGASVVADEHGRCQKVLGCEPVSTGLLYASWIDTMALVDVDALLELDGLDVDAHGLQDWELVLRLLHLRRPITFVPTVVGYYRASPLSMIADAPGSRRLRRLQRMYGIDGPLDPAALCASVHHPATGYLERTPAWSGPEIAAPFEASVPPVAGRILVVGSGGVRNHGDDAILLATLARLDRVRPGCMPVVVSDGDAPPPLGRLGVWAGTTDELCRGLDPSAIRMGCSDPGLAETLVRDVGAAGTPLDPSLADLRAFDAVLFCGGGNLASFWRYIAAWRAAIAAAARAQGIPYVVSGQGVGPLSAEVMPLVADLAAGAIRFGVRDPGSAELLAAHGIAANVDVVGDDALGLVATADVAALGVPTDRPLLGFQVRRADYVGCDDAALQRLARAVDALAADAGMTVVAIPMNAQPWAPEATLQLELLAALGARRARWALADVGDDVTAAASVIRACAAVVTCSFHTALFALERGIPAALVTATDYYARKAVALERQFDVPCAVGVPVDAPAADLAERLDAMRLGTWTPRAAADAVSGWLDAVLPR